MRKFIPSVLRFLAVFAFLYLSCLAIIGLAAPGGLYIPFVQKYLDFISWISHSLVWGTQQLAGWLGYQTYSLPRFIVRVVNGTGVRIAYDCVGYGVMSFWAAFIITSPYTLKKKIIWTLIGWVLLWIINVGRITGLLIAYNKHWGMPLGIDHHTWFNIVSYIAIFTMIFLMEKTHNRQSKTNQINLPS